MSNIATAQRVIDLAEEVKTLTEEEFLLREQHPFLIVEALLGLEPGGEETTGSGAPRRGRDSSGGFRTLDPETASRAFLDSLEYRVLRLRKTDRNPFASMITIGRSKNNDLILPYRSISKFHAYFQQESDGRLALVDANSRNGTLLGGERLQAKEKYWPKDDDVIEFAGGVCLRFYGPGEFYRCLQAIGRMLEQMRTSGL